MVVSSLFFFSPLDYWQVYLQSLGTSESFCVCLLWVTWVSSSGLQPLYVLHMMTQSGGQALSCLWTEPWAPTLADQCVCFLRRQFILLFYQSIDWFWWQFQAVKAVLISLSRSWQVQWSMRVSVHCVFKRGCTSGLIYLSIMCNMCFFF